jgi:hypothetical protein
MQHDIQLDGMETTIIKALGLGGGGVDGATLLERCAPLEFADVASTLRGLMDLGYVEGDAESFHSEDLFMKLNFNVNSGYAKDLRQALDPKDDEPKSKRVRRE